MYFEMNFEMSDLCFIAGCISCTLKDLLVFFSGAERIPPFSWVKIINSVTTLWLTCFDYWCIFYEPFITNLAPRSLTKVPAIFFTWQYSKLLPMSVLKVNI